MPERPAPSALRLAPGSVFDQRYEVVRELGQGGSAVVYEVRHLHLGRPAALKVLRELEDAQREALRARMMHEARALAALDHAHIVKVYDAQVGPPSFLVMELLEGHSVEQECQLRGPLSPARAVRWMLQCLSGLSAIHARGLVHKDLKPSNLFLVAPSTPQERLVILDFSAATACDDPEARLTGRFELVGTPQYMAPEYIGGGAPTRTGDLYQAGLTLAELLMGRPALRAHSAAECMARHCHGLLDIPSQVRAGPLGAVLARALAVKPEERHPSADALRQELEQLLPSLSPQAQPEEAREAALEARTTLKLWSLSAPPASEAQPEAAEPVLRGEVAQDHEAHDQAQAIEKLEPSDLGERAPREVAKLREAKTASLRAPARGESGTARLPRVAGRRWGAWALASALALALLVGGALWLAGGAAEAGKAQERSAQPKKKAAPNKGSAKPKRGSKPEKALATKPHQEGKKGGAERHAMAQPGTARAAPSAP